MNRRTAIWSTLFLWPFGSAEAQPTGTNTAPVPTPGQYPGTVTNDAAVAGNIGEFATANLSAAGALTVSTGIGTSIIGVSLTAGDWDVWGTAIFHSGAAGTVFSALVAAVSTTAGSSAAGMPGLVSGQQIELGLGGGLTNPADTGLATPSARISLAATATAFLNGSLTFSVSTASAYGIIAARRRR